MTIAENPIAARFKALADRYTEPRAAAYLGVATHTFRKWVTGERKPSASTIRLLDVLATIETLAPSLHENMLPK